MLRTAMNVGGEHRSALLSNVSGMPCGGVRSSSSELMPNVLQLVAYLTPGTDFDTFDLNADSTAHADGMMSPIACWQECLMLAGVKSLTGSGSSFVLLACCAHKMLPLHWRLLPFCRAWAPQR